MAHVCPKCNANICDGDDNFVCMKCFDCMWEEMNAGVLDEYNDEYCENLVLRHEFDLIDNIKGE